MFDHRGRICSDLNYFLDVSFLVFEEKQFFMFDHRGFICSDLNYFFDVSFLVSPKKKEKAPKEKRALV